MESGSCLRTFGWFLLGLVLLAFSVPMWLGLRDEFPTSRSSQQSVNWPTTAGVIVESRVRRTTGDYSSEYPVIRYEYEVDDHVYRSSDIGFGPGNTKMSDLTKFPEDKRVTVYYQPDRPETAVLEPERLPNYLQVVLITLVLIVYTLSSFSLIWAAVSHMRGQLWLT